jgi:hypothetical protein
MRNYFLDKAIENIDLVFSNFIHNCMNNIYMASDNTANFIVNTNKFYVLYQDALGIRKKDLLSDSDKRLVQTTKNIEKTYDLYRNKNNKVKEYNTSQNNHREFDV